MKITECKICGKLLTKQQINRKREQCSRECGYISNRKSRVKRNCKTCGKEIEVTEGVLKYHPSNYCSNKCKHDGKRMSYDKVAEFFINQGCYLLSESYTNDTTPLEYICKCGELGEATWRNFKYTKHCEECSKAMYGIKQKHSYEFIKEEFRKGGCELLSKEYKHSKQKLKILCVCGEIAYVRYANFRLGQGCSNCKIIKISGPNSCNWNPNITEKERLEKRNIMVGYNDWRKTVFERDNYQCQICTYVGPKLCAHHLDGFAENPDKRLSIDNGTTLCTTCHDEFHKIYGKMNITKQQFEDWTIEELVGLSV